MRITILRRSVLLLIALNLVVAWARAAEPKKVEPAKAEPKKAEPVKAEPKKAEPVKAEPKAQPAAKPKVEITGGIPMTFERNPRLITGARVVVKMKPDLSSTGDSSSISIAGKECKLAVRKNGDVCMMALDGNGDGRIGAGETARVDPRNGVAIFDVATDTGRTAVMLCEIRIGSKNNSVTSIAARICPGGCMKGEYGGVAIRIIDENLDGKYTQDGKDAIAFGNNPVAVPLLQTHCIQDKHFRFQVAEDGGKLALEPLTDAPMGEVETPFSGSTLKCLVMASKTGAYDLAGGKTNIPAGDYQMVFGVMAAGGRMVNMYPPVRHGRLLRYKVEAGTTNRLRIGPPFRIETELGVTAMNVLTVRPSFRLMGSGGEEYGPVDFSAAGNAQIQIGTGERVLASDMMKRGAEYTTKVPPTLENGWVRVRMRLPVFGLVSGTKNFDGKEMLEDGDAPAVSHPGDEKKGPKDAKDAKAGKAGKKVEK
ncbi:MAG TPA: hypothetical protein PKG77_07895 [Phycisphaerae bacterium]|nr:hypothetical protein [Phycisphaerae bacterium]HQL74582.1 hypothetical protein [Phycisphaerae bacterium]